ncbi:MAG: hypothetical protein JO108_35605 [Acidobacteriaceae bacterium]|nr:hypothetical protein [Acidobacteriaceae bacterium]
MNLPSISAPLSIILSALLAVSPVRAQMGSSGRDSSIEDLQISVSGLSSALPGTRQGSPMSIRVLDLSGSPVSEAAIAVRLPDTDPSGVFPDGSHSLVAYTDVKGEAIIDGIRWGETSGSVHIRVTATKGASHAGTLVEEQIGAPQIAPANGSVLSSRLSITSPPVSSVAPIGAPAAIAPAPPVAVESVGRRLAPGSYPSAVEPSVSVTNVRSGDLNEPSFHSSHLKWIIIATVLAGGAGAAIALMHRGSSSSSSSSSAVTIGAPTITVGAP